MISQGDKDKQNSKRPSGQNTKKAKRSKVASTFESALVVDDISDSSSISDEEPVIY